MSPDNRNSVQLWTSGIAVFWFIWAAWRFQWFDDMSDGWFGLIASLIGFANLAFLLHGLWQRRGSNPRNPNRP